MGQDRILGSSVVVDLYLPTGPLVINELDSFTSDRKSSQKQFQPLGQVGERTQDIPGHWELSLTGAIVDTGFDAYVQQVESAGQAGQQNIRAVVKETTTYYSGAVVTYVWADTVLYNFKKEDTSAKDEIKYSFTGAAQTRTQG